MKKIWQKSLASMVSAALCLTAFVGCLTVNAATTYEGTITSKGVEVSETAESATVTLNISSPNAAMNIAAIAATTDFGTLTDVAVEGDNCKIDENKNLAEGRFYVDAIANEKGFTTATVILTFTKAEGLQKGNYPVTITYFAKESAATWNEDIVNLVVTADINITVTSAHTHTWEFVSGTPAINNGANGVINFRCACGETKTVNDVTYLAASTLQAPDIGCTATTQLILKASVAKYADATAGYVTVTHHFADGTPDSVEVLDIKDAKEENGYYKWIIGVNSKNFTDSFTTAFFTERNGSWVSGAERDFSIKSAAMSAINSAQSSEGIKKTAANLLVMGSKVQTRFPYATDNLADSELVGNLANYVTNTTPVVAKNDKNFVRDNTGVQNGEKLGFGNPSVSLGDSISINFNVVTKYYDLSSLSNLKLVATYTSYNGVHVTSDVTKYTTNTSGQYVFSFEVTAPNMRVPVSIQLFDGDTPVSNCATYSVEGVIAHALSSDASLSEVVYSIMNYSDAAVEAFQ